MVCLEPTNYDVSFLYALVKSGAHNDEVVGVHVHGVEDTELTTTDAVEVLANEDIDGQAKEDAEGQAKEDVEGQAEEDAKGHRDADESTRVRELAMPRHHFGVAHSAILLDGSEDLGPQSEVTYHVSNFLGCRKSVCLHAKASSRHRTKAKFE